MKRTQICYEFQYIAHNNYDQIETSGQLNEVLTELDAFNPKVIQLTSTTTLRKKDNYVNHSELIDSLWCIIEYDIS